MRRRLQFWRSYFYRGCFHACALVGARRACNRLAQLEMDDTLRVARRFA